jgi:UDP-4-amino-4,6-dideoxy-N-acetyl-beta-L-altrosamine N-acetyltransferase
MSGHLRNIEQGDLPIIRGWRNHPDINRYMFSQHEIKEQEHCAWFEASQKNSLRTLSVYEEDGCIRGFLQLQKKSQDCGVYEWGFYTSPSAERGTGVKLGELAFHNVFVEMGGTKLVGEVLSFNLPSIKFHKKLGFVQEGVLRKQHLLNGQYYDVICFGLLKAEWLKWQVNGVGS